MRRLSWGAAAVAAGLAIPATATAATNPPTATTGGATAITPTNAIVHGSVNPRGTATSYHFIYGTTKAYGASTGPTPVGAGTTAVKVTAPLNNLAPATTYHYRLIAENTAGQSGRGVDRTFKTKRQPLGVSLAGNPNPTRTGAGTTLAGTLTGTGNAGRQVVLQANPWPYTQGFLNAANPQVTDANGNFSFPVLSVPVNTQYRVVMPQRPDVVSPIVVEGTANQVTEHIRVHRHRKSGHLHFWGSIYPPMDGTQVLVQKLVNGQWKTFGKTVAKHRNSTRSAYSKWIWNKHGGQYRVVHNAPEPHVPSAGRTRTIHRTRS